MMGSIRNAITLKKIEDSENAAENVKEAFCTQAFLNISPEALDDITRVSAKRERGSDHP